MPILRLKVLPDGGALVTINQIGEMHLVPTGEGAVSETRRLAVKLSPTSPIHLVGGVQPGILASGIDGLHLIDPASGDTRLIRPGASPLFSVLDDRVAVVEGGAGSDS